jgi:hypothetical protein
MKYGLLVNRGALNLGDDIQSYAESLFLPKIDYLVDREHISDFKPKRKDEAVAVIMGAWWTRHKWHFPPPRNIYPLLTSMHLTDYPPEHIGTPIYDELFTGVGGEYMKAYGPVGTRDMATLDAMNNLGIPSYFSGCVTLTLPKQKKKKLKKEYVLLVDLDPRVEAKVRRQLVGADVEVKKVSNNRATRRTDAEMDSWDFREKETVELLELYQNAKCVVTRRLHVSLPCLAMEVPVLCVHNPKNIRFSPYNNWLHMVSPNDFLKGKYDYDILNPKPNKTDYLEVREKLTKQMKEFVEQVGKDKRPLDEIVKTTYTDEDVYRWQYDLMKFALNKWLPASVKMSKQLIKLKAERKELLAKIGKREETVYTKSRRFAGKTLRKLGLRK